MHRSWKLMMAGLMLTATSMTACRDHMPHAFTWPGGGKIVQSHAKPPEGGYYSNWDPFAVELEVSPVQAVNAVRTQHVFVATVRDKDGKPLPNRRVEWMIAEGSVGDIVEVDESGWRASRGYKVDNHYAVSHTNNYDHTLDMGTDDPSDDIELQKGQTWCVITSPIEGDTHMTVYAPGIYDWNKHKVFATKHWYDVAWEWPMPATNPTGTTHDFVTRVFKHSDGTPLEGYQVTYTIQDGPAGSFAGAGQTTTVTTDSNGDARVTLQQAQPAEGTNNVAISIVRPADIQCCKPAVNIAEGYTSKTWVGPKIDITKDAPATALVGEEFNYTIVVSNPSQVTATNVTVSDNLPDGISYVSSSPQSNSGGPALSWSLGSLAGGASTTISVTVSGTRTGTFDNCAEVRADQGLSDRDCAQTRISAPALVLEKDCPPEVMLCESIPYVIRVRNTGDGTATNIRIVDELAPGLVAENGNSSLVFEVPTLGPGEAREGRITVRAERTGTFVNRARATGDGGLTAEADCTTVVKQATLQLSKTGPSVRYIGRPATYELTVTNSGDAAARDTVLTDEIPSGVSFVSASDGGNRSGGNVVWNLGTLQPGESRTVTVDVTANSAGSVRNRATARAVCADGEAEHVMEIKGIPAILLEVIDLQDPIEVGGNVTYEITVTNQGSAVGNNIRVSAVIPSQQEYVSSDGITQATAEGTKVNFAPLPSLAPGAKATFRLTARCVSEGDSRIRVSMVSDETEAQGAIEETESTRIY